MFNKKLLKLLGLLLPLALLGIACQLTPPVSPIKLSINEFMASNNKKITDENKEKDDWVEIYNPGNDPVDIGGMYVSDDKLDPKKWKIPAADAQKTSIPGHGYLVLWFDKQPQQGVLHVNFKLSKSGEDLILSDAQGRLIDSYTFTSQESNISLGRMPDGNANWQTFKNPTPGTANK